MKTIINFSSSLLLLLLLTNCKTNENKIIFYSDLEKNSMNDITLTDQFKAHSGMFCSKIDSIYTFSYGIQKNLGSISNEPLSLIKVKAWVNMPIIADDVLLVVCINSNNKTEFWNPIQISGLMNKPNTWNEIKVEIPIKDKYPTDYVFKTYLMTKNSIAYIDDIEVTYE